MKNTMMIAMLLVFMMAMILLKIQVPAVEAVVAAPVDPKVESEKKVRAIKKKLRQIDELLVGFLVTHLDTNFLR